MATAFEGVIFDLDGTLIDSLEDIANAANQVLQSLERATIPVSEFRFLVGDGVGVLMERMMPEARTDGVFRAECMNRFERYYAQHWNKRTKPYDGICELLESLVRAGVAMAVLSNKPDAFTQRCVEHFFPHVPFREILGHSDRFPKKPDPASAQWIAQELGIASDRMAYVGDTNTDMKTAETAGFFAMGVTWGFRSRDELVASGADVVYDHPSELLMGLLGR